MNSLTSYIEAAAVAALAGTGTFVHDSPELATLVLNSAMLPAIIYGEPTLAQADASSRVETSTVTLYFATSKPGAGDSAALHYGAVAQMDALKHRFFSLLDSSPYVRIDALKATPFANAYEAMLDGVGCQFLLTVPSAPLVVRCLPV